MKKVDWATRPPGVAPFQPGISISAESRYPRARADSWQGNSSPPHPIPKVVDVSDVEGHFLVNSRAIVDLTNLEGIDPFVVDSFAFLGVNLFARFGQVAVRTAIDVRTSPS